MNKMDICATNQPELLLPLHWPAPEFPFELIVPQVALASLSGYTTRVFAIPPANALMPHVLNGYVYLSAQSVTDPAITGEMKP